MAWVITRMCRDCVDMACVEVCPVDCIVQHKNKADAPGYENQLYIDPEECINCGVCEPECPWEAIFEDEQVPAVFVEDTALNAKIVDERDDFEVPERADADVPTPDQIATNKAKWDYAGYPRVNRRLIAAFSRSRDNEGQLDVSWPSSFVGRATSRTRAPRELMSGVVERSSHRLGHVGERLVGWSRVEQPRPDSKLLDRLVDQHPLSADGACAAGLGIEKQLGSFRRINGIEHGHPLVQRTGLDGRSHFREPDTGRIDEQVRGQVGEGAEISGVGRAEVTGQDACAFDGSIEDDDLAVPLSQCVDDGPGRSSRTEYHSALAAHGRHSFEGAERTDPVGVGADETVADTRDGIDCSDAACDRFDLVDQGQHGFFVGNRNRELPQRSFAEVCDRVGQTVRGHVVGLIGRRESECLVGRAVHRGRSRVSRRMEHDSAAMQGVPRLFGRSLVSRSRARGHVWLRS